MKAGQRRVSVLLVGLVFGIGCVGDDESASRPAHGAEQDPGKADIVAPVPVRGPSAFAESSFEGDVDVHVAAEPETLFPGVRWPTGDPVEHGFRRDRLEAARDYSEDVGGKCLLVVHDGALVYEDYYNGGGPQVLNKGWSISKTFTSMLVGIAIGEGHIGSVEDSAADYIPQWQGTEYEAITVRHLLSMDSGLRFDFLDDNLWTLTSDDMTMDAVQYGMDVQPGRRWRYSNHAVQVLEAVLRNATGWDVEEYAMTRLWGPMGFDAGTHWERDRAGHPATFMGVHLTCRDLARFGYLLLQDGRWEDEQLIPADYVEDALLPSQDLNAVYGYLVWLNGYAPAMSARHDPYEGGTMFPDAPDDIVSLQGLGQNFCDIIPSRQTLIVHMRPAPQEELFDDPLGTIDRLLGDADRGIHRDLLEILAPVGDDAQVR